MKLARKIFAANWKLQKSPRETRDFFREFAKVPAAEGSLFFFPPATSWEACAESVKGTVIQWGAQNVWSETKGAFTGENSASVLKELGGTCALVGHSERRRLFEEPEDWFAAKVAALQTLDLVPFLCFGETLDEREAGKTDDINRHQLTTGLAKAAPKKPIVFAYEPVWAIGTGKVATPEQVAAAHEFAHGVLRELGFGESRLLYGGSVKPDNAAGLLGLPHVDGFLVGGASLEPGSFAAIAKP